ncbi:MAG: shikimate dehydrogenase [Clostridia bacterium]|nr:shikimate dehydrogenase [Clostridia bacterium]
MRRYAVIGCPIEHSRSPEIYLPLFEKYGIEADFTRIRVERGELGRAMERLRALDGFAVTMPHKAAILPFLDRVSEGAAEVGAANIITKENGLLTGHNTDGEGLKNLMLSLGIDPNGLRVFILGRGGAARAAAYALQNAGAQAIHLVRSLRPDTGRCEMLSDPAALERAGECGAFINATPLGMAGGEEFSSFDILDALRPKAVFDMVYRPGETTALVSAAAARGIPAYDGTGMLVHQGLIAFKLWTGEDASPEDIGFGV